jgi:hypothetical protein
MLNEWVAWPMEVYIMNDWRGYEPWTKNLLIKMSKILVVRIFRTTKIPKSKNHKPLQIVTV